jgi:hypothetical protein
MPRVLIKNAQPIEFGSSKANPGILQFSEPNFSDNSYASFNE